MTNLTIRLSNKMDADIIDDILISLLKSKEFPFNCKKEWIIWIKNKVLNTDKCKFKYDHELGVKLKLGIFKRKLLTFNYSENTDYIFVSGGSEYSSLEKYFTDEEIESLCYFFKKTFSEYILKS